MLIRLIGYWSGGWSTDGPWPDPRDFIDSTWNEQERNLVASYLEEGFVPWIAHGFSTCRLCGKSNGSGELTDGVFLWPEGLAHYVRDHSVRLPDEVISHMTDGDADGYDEPTIEQAFELMFDRQLDPEVLDDSSLIDREWWRSQRGE